MTAPLAAVAALAGAALVSSAIAIEAERLRLPPMPPSAGVGPRLSAALAMRRFSADRNWIDTLQYCGDTAFILDGGERLFGMSNRTLDFDPSFEEACAYGAGMLMWQCKRPEEATALLRRGIAYNPEALRLKYYLAAFTYRKLNDLKGELGVLEVLARDPAAPFILRRILANAYEKQDMIGKAARIWGLIWLTTANPDERRWVSAKCAKYGIDPAKFHAGPPRSVSK